MRLTELQKKTLGKLKVRAIAETEPYFEDARPIFEQLAKKGLAERVEDDFGDFVWEATEAGSHLTTRSGRASRSN